MSNSEVIFSNIPSLRRANNNTELFDDYYSMQLYRRRIVSDDLVTKYGAVLESVKDNQKSLIKDVEWYYPEDNTQMSIAVKIVFDDFYDIIYISDDFIKREAFGLEFSAKYAAVRTYNHGSVEWSYLYSGGSIKAGDKLFNGISDIVSKICSVTSDSDYSSFNEIVFEGENDSKEIVGKHVMCMMDDGFGYGYIISDVFSENGQTHLVIKDTPAFKIENGKVQLKYHDGLLLKENERINTKYFYNMFVEKSFDNVKAYIKFPVFEKN